MRLTVLTLLYQGCCSKQLLFNVANMDCLNSRRNYCLIAQKKNTQNGWDPESQGIIH